jgi:hypothetical protein
MVQVLPERAPKPRNPDWRDALVAALQGGAQGYEKGSELRSLQEEKNRLTGERNAENEAFKLRGIDLSNIQDAKLRNLVASAELQGKREKENIQERIKQSEPKELKKKQEEESKISNALNSVQEMKNIRKQGNLGLGTGLWSKLGGKTAKDKGKYETLGKSLIQYVSSIPVRNRAEFEEFAHGLTDANISDAEAEGILDSMEQLLNNAIMGETREEFQDHPVAKSYQGKQKKRPLSAFD